MAPTGKKGKKNKGKAVPLNDFLSNTTASWSDIVDEEEKFSEFNRKPALPAAPRAARVIEFDESKIPKFPPYVAYLSNLAYELEQDDIINAFTDLNISNVRLPRDERSGRMKGFGYVEFSDRGSFIAALQKNEATIRGRRIRIDVAENNEGERRRGGLRDNKERESNYDPERTSGDWRSGPRSEFSGGEDRRAAMSGRKDYGGFRDRDGYDKGRGESSWRDNERRFGSERESRGSYGSRRNYDEQESSYSEPKTRPKLNLKPRTRPVEEIIEEPSTNKDEESLPQDKPASTSANIFGQAKPVDTAAREREIERRLEKEREEAKNEKDRDKSRTRNEEDLVDSKNPEPAPEPRENIWVRKSQKLEAQSATAGDHSSGKLDYSESSHDNEVGKENLESSEDSHYIDSRGNGDYESDGDGDTRYNRYDNRYNDTIRESDRSFRRDDRYRDDRDRRDRERRDDRRDRGYDSDRRGGGSVGRSRDQDRDGESRRYNDRDGDSRRYNDRDGDSRRYNDRDGDHKRFGSDREGDWRRSNDKDADNKRHTDRDTGRYRDDHGNNKGPRVDKRSGLSTSDKGPRQGKNLPERERAPQNKPRDQKKSEDGLKMPKLKEAATPNYIGTNKYSFLDEDEVSE